MMMNVSLHLFAEQLAGRTDEQRPEHCKKSRQENHIHQTNNAGLCVNVSFFFSATSLSELNYFAQCACVTIVDLMAGSQVYNRRFLWSPFK